MLRNFSEAGTAGRTGAMEISPAQLESSIKAVGLGWWGLPKLEMEMTHTGDVPA